MEEWRPVFGYEDLYEVSDHGNVRSLDRVNMQKRLGSIRRVAYKGRVLRPAPNGKGYPTVNLSRNGKQETGWVHRLVCRAWHGPCPNGHCAAHNDGNPLNCRADNLRWATYAENMADKKLHGTQPRGEEIHSVKLSEADIRIIRSSSLSDRKLAKLFGVCGSNVNLIKNRKRWAHV